MKNIEAALQQRREQQRYRQRRIASSAQQPHMRVDGKNIIAFCSNDYLGLANHPKLIEAMQRAATTYGVGSGAAHLINGHSRYHHALEEALANFTGRPRALLFSTGYMANLGIIQALAGRHDDVFADRLNHASLLDGVALSRARLHRYPHKDVAKLEQLLIAHPDSHKFIITDSVFSMDGDIAPLPQLANLASQHQALLMVDDAHGFGVLGENGKGSLAHFNLQSTQDIPIYMATLGKALGTAGAFVAGSESLIEYFIQTARSYIYTTAMPAAIAATTLASLEILQAEPERRLQLFNNIRFFRQQAEQLSLPLEPTTTPIQCIILGQDALALQAADALYKNGFLVTAIRPPTVPEGSARLRITLSATHKVEDISRLLTALKKILPTT